MAVVLAPLVAYSAEWSSHGVHMRTSRSGARLGITRNYDVSTELETKQQGG